MWRIDRATTTGLLSTGFLVAAPQASMAGSLANTERSQPSKDVTASTYVAYQPHLHGSTSIAELYVGV